MAEIRLTRSGLPFYTTGSDTQLSRADWNEATTSLDTTFAMFAQGVRSARPAAGKAGRFYRATDTGELFWDTGSVWVDAVTVLQALTVAGLLKAGSLEATTAFIGPTGQSGVGLGTYGNGVIALENRGSHPGPHPNGVLVYCIGASWWARYPDGSIQKIGGPY